LRLAYTWRSHSINSDAFLNIKQDDLYEPL
jgi:hypothetical protein